MIAVKRLSTTESATKIAFYLQVFGMLFTAPNTALSWQTPTAFEWLLLAAIGVIGTLGLVTQARAYGLGEPTAVAPVDFTRLPLAVAIGILFFGEVPSASALVGMGLVAASIFLISRRERGRAKSSAKTARE